MGEWYEFNINNRSRKWKFKKYKGKQRYLHQIYEAVKCFDIITFGHFSQQDFKKGQLRGPIEKVKKFLVNI